MLGNFEFQELDLLGAYLVKPFYAPDMRGGFIKDYNIDIFRNNGIQHELRETFYTVSKRGVIRAIHFQNIKQQPKLVRCIKGRIYDVIVDLRPESPTYKRWRGFYLSGDNMKSIYIPSNFGHGYLVLEDSIVSYKCGEVFVAEGDSGIRYDDADLGIAWPWHEIGGQENLIISDKDRSLQLFQEYDYIMKGENAAWHK